MNGNFTRNRRVYVDNDFVRAQRFNRVLDFYFLLVQIQLVLSLRCFAHIFTGNRTKDFTAFAYFNGDSKFHLFKLARQDYGFVRSYLSLMGSSCLFLFGIINIFRRSRCCQFTGQEEITAVAFGNLYNIAFFA